MAELAAYVSNGEVVEVKDYSRNSNTNNHSKKFVQKKTKQAKSNQAWMKKR